MVGKADGQEGWRTSSADRTWEVEGGAPKECRRKSDAEE